MLELDIPLQLPPVFKPKIWGREDLGPFFAEAQRPVPQARGSAVSGQHPRELIGEVWLTDDAARFRNGPVAGLTLGEASRAYGTALHGKRWKGSRFPVLAKYLFISDWLSVQVHPDDDYARAHEPGSLGKCEMWYILQAERNARCLLGSKPGVTRKSFRTALEKGTSQELLYEFRPQAGEAIFAPPGTVHALGPGLILFEVEQNSDLTYRLHDFGRVGPDGKPRPLHLKKALDVIRPELPAYRDLPRFEFREPYGSRRWVLACRHFAVEELQLRKRATFLGSPERVEGLSVLSGPGRVETRAGWLAYRPGDTWLIPPATESYRLVPERNTRLLRFYAPDLDKDFRRPLSKRGVRSTEIRKVCFD